MSLSTLFARVRSHGGIDAPRNTPPAQTPAEAPAQRPETPVWNAFAIDQIKEWFIRSKYIEKFSDASTDGYALFSNVIRTYCSRETYEFWSRIARIVTARAGWPDLDGKSGMVLGCDWGTGALYLAESAAFRQLVAVDQSAKFSCVARSVIERFPGRFPGLAVIDAGPGQIARRYADDCDFLVATNGFPLIDAAIDRKELLRALQVLKEGGFLLVQYRNEEGFLRYADLTAILAGAGFDEVTLLAGEGAALSGPDIDRGVAFVAARKGAQIRTTRIDAILAEIGQDEVSLAGRHPQIEYPAETELQRLRRIHDEISKGHTVLKSAPSEYTLNLLSVCNIKCIFCDYPDRLRHWAISQNFLQDLIATLEGTSRLRMTGGETFLSPQALTIIDRAADYPDLMIQAVSNMTLSRPGFVETLAKGLSYLTCSLDAATKQTYDRIRQDSDWDGVISNLKRLAALRRQGKSKLIDLDVNFIIMSQNMHEIVDFVRLGAEIGATSVSFKWLDWMLTPRITPETKLDMSDDRVAGIVCRGLADAYALGPQCGIAVDMSPCLGNVETLRPDLFKQYNLEQCFSRSPFADDIAPLGAEHCDDPELRAARDRVDIMPDGLMPCARPFTTLQIGGPTAANFCCYSTTAYRAVPVDTGAGLMQAWNHPKFVEARELFLKGDYEKVCRPVCILYQRYLRNVSQAKEAGDALTGGGTGGGAGGGTA